ncbi:MAG: hypothetical protein IAF58_18770 [Leptolyngbya sp.]|nr:hypothetical protein [Candidatus Melainabacteria bacterium]
MGTLVGLLALCVAPFVGAFFGEKIVAKQWLSSIWRVYVASAVVVALSAWLFFSSAWLAIFVLTVSYFAIRDGRAFPPHYYPHDQYQLPNQGGDYADSSTNRQRPPRSKWGHVRLAVDNGHFPPKGKSAKRGKLRSVK